jgi:hypothetical protein
MECWTVVQEWSAGDWSTGMEYWTGGVLEGIMSNGVVFEVRGGGTL